MPTDFFDEPVAATYDDDPDPRFGIEALAVDAHVSVWERADEYS